MQPILVTGSHRSGTTWFGDVLGLSGELAVIHEPYNPANKRTWFSEPANTWFEASTSATATADRIDDVGRILSLKPRASDMIARSESLRDAAAAARDLLRASQWRLQRRQALLKDPIAFFAAPWLAERFDVRPIILARHPAAFAGSLKKLDWQFDFRNWTNQEHLLRGPLAPFAEEIERAASHQPDIISQATLMWRAIYHVARHDYAKRDRWIFRRYEDFATDPIPSFQALYSELNLNWNSDVVKKMGPLIDGGSTGGRQNHMSTSRNSRDAMTTWKRRLSTEEIRTVRLETAEVAESLYSDSDWD